MLTLEQLRHDYRPQILALAAKHGVEDIRVFGSVARGDASEKSDVDFLCHLPQGITIWEMAGMQYDLEELLSVPVDLVPDTNTGIKHRFLTSILSEAVTL
jgi:predicted nucleotidyltransferase